jgi:hypothetical protein
MSFSSNLRLEGNQFYCKAFELIPNTLSLPELIRIEHAKSAIAKYGESRLAASKEGDSKNWLSATKNFSLTCFKLASLQGFQNRNDKVAILYYFNEALKYLIEAIVNGKRISMDQLWITDLEKKQPDIVNGILRFIINNSTDWRIRCTDLSYYLTTAVLDPTGMLEILVYLEIANEIHKSFVASNNWKEILHLTAEMCQPLSKVHDKLLSLSLDLNSSDLFERYNELKKAKDYYHSRAKSEQALQQGIALQTHVVFETEDFNAELAWTVIDFYSSALTEAAKCDDLLQTVIICYESAAKAAIYLGIFLYLGLKNEEQAHQRLLQGVQYIDVVTHTDGRTFFNQKWYQEAKKLIEEYRSKRLAYDQKQIEKLRAPTLTELKPELDKIKEKLNIYESKQFKCYELLKHVYSTHMPPTIEEKKCQEINEELKIVDKNDREKMKKLCLKAVNHYHPDKQKNKEKGIKWYVLCEEIVKELNNHNDSMK